MSYKSIFCNIGKNQKHANITSAVESICFGKLNEVPKQRSKTVLVDQPELFILSSSIHLEVALAYVGHVVVTDDLGVREEAEMMDVLLIK